MEPRIIALTGAAWPSALITEVQDNGVFIFSWLNQDGNPVDSGGSIGRLAEGVEPTDANLAAAIASPAPDPLPVHRVLKDTIIQRVKAAGKLPQLRTVIDTLDADQRFEWDNSSWFSSNNPLLLAGMATLELNASDILAFDPLAP
jgi:hypothetical protein